MRSLKTFLQPLSLDKQLEKDLLFSSCVADSQQAQIGSLFFALPGTKTNGHLFLEDAKQRGSVAAIVDATYSGDSFGLVLIRVDQPLQTLHSLAKEAIKVSGAKIIGITGSVGKTTTKEFTATLLEPLGKVWKSPGNANSQIGLPISILNAPKADLYVLEMGMSEEGEIAKLVQIAPPHFVLVTKIGLAHVQFFSDGIRGIARAKGEILSPNSKPFGIFSMQVNTFEPFTSYSNKRLVGRGGDYELEQTEGGVYITSKEKIIGPIVLPFEETHLKENFALVASLGLELGLKEEDLRTQAKKLQTPPRRFEKKWIKDILFVNDSYNAQPQAVLAALENFPQTEKKRIAVLGSMRELGAYSDAAHEEVGKKAAEICDMVLCIGTEAKPLIEQVKKQGKPCYYYSELQSLSEALIQLAMPGDVVLIKGAKLHQLWKVLDYFSKD